jgi:4-alpha-glucanotransferase
MLRRHALFDALDCHFRPQGAHGWRGWPAAYHDPAGAAATRFAAEHADEVAFHLFVQWLARQGLAAAQAAAKEAGMAIGLIGDLAVGVDPSGSDAWSAAPCDAGRADHRRAARSAGAAGAELVDHRLFARRPARQPAMRRGSP